MHIKNHNLGMVAGNHALRFGVELRWEQDNSSLVGGSRPLYVFDGLFNLANSAPVFESIDANPQTGGPATAQRYFRTPYYGVFVQDDWKVRPNFTLNLGLRWEYFSPPYQNGATLSNIAFGSNGLANSHLVQVNHLYNSDFNNFAPRLGFAWSPHTTSNFVVRGGFGIFYNRIPEVLFANALANPPNFARYGVCCGTAATPFVNGQIVYTLGSSNSPFSYPANPGLAQGINPATGAPSAAAVEIWGAQANTPNPMVYVFSLDAEYKLPGKIVADLGYSGSAGHHLIRLVNQNFLYPNNLSNPNNGAAFSAVYIPQPDDNSDFNAGILTLRRQFDHGFLFAFNYRWSKSLDNSSYEGPGFATNQTFPQNNHSEWGPSDFDVTHIYTFSAVYEVPGSHRHNGLWRALVGGWELSPIISWHTGFPWTPVIGQSVQTPGGPSLSPIRPTVYFGGAGHSESNLAYMTGLNFINGGPAYFNTTASGPPGIGRNSWRGPHFFQTDMSFAKNIRFPFFFRESANMELRANFFNIFNQLNLQPLGFSGGGTHPDQPFFGVSPGALAGRVVELQARFSF